MKNTLFIALSAITLFSCSKINSVTIESSPNPIYKRDTVQLKAIVNKAGSPDTTINWQIVEPVVKGTSISKDGKLVIDANEKASQLTIRAFAAGDTSKSNAHSVKLAVNPKYFYGTWISKAEGITRELTITNNSWEQKNSNGSSYNFIKQTWETSVNENPITSEEFPEGCQLEGYVEKRHNFEIGITEHVWVYLNKDKTKFVKTTSEPLTSELVGAVVVWTKKN